MEVIIASPLTLGYKYEKLKEERGVEKVEREREREREIQRKGKFN